MSGTGESGGITAPFLGSVGISQCDVAAPLRGDDNPAVGELVLAHLHSLLPSALCMLRVLMAASSVRCNTGTSEPKLGRSWATGSCHPSNYFHCKLDVA